MTDVSQRQELVTATRELMLAVTVTDVDRVELESATDAIRAITERLSIQRRARGQKMPFSAAAQTRADSPDRAITLSPYNPIGIPLAVTFGEDGSASATLVADALLEGPRDAVHGGTSAWLLDALFGVLVRAQGIQAVTGTLELRYRHRTPLDQPLGLYARVKGRSGRKIQVEGWIEHEGRHTVEANGLFIAIDAPAPGGV